MIQIKIHFAMKSICIFVFNSIQIAFFADNVIIISLLSQKNGLITEANEMYKVNRFYKGSVSFPFEMAHAFFVATLCSDHESILFQCINMRLNKK